MFEKEFEQTLNAIGAAEGFEIHQFSELYGGSINRVLFLETSEGKKVIKLNRAREFPKMFEAEKTGLETLKNSKSFETPQVFACGKLDETAYLLLEHIPKTRPAAGFWKLFAENLADLHQCSHPYFGFSEPNYIGSLPQFNNKENSAAEFYVHQRLEPQFRLASENGYAFKNLKNLFKNVSSEIPDEKPALIHGDLWNGNYMVAQNGRPCLIDPAVCFGPREMDLAMMQLFGGFPDEVFAAYHELFPLAPQVKKRVLLWQLYYLLVHLNLFGHGYFGQVRRIVDAFS